MYLDDTSTVLENSLLNDDLLFEYSPVESLINFELPSSLGVEDQSWQISDFSVNCDALVSDVSDRSKDEFNISDYSPAFFDFDDLDKSVDLDEYLLEALSDKSSDVPSSSADSVNSNDGASLGRLSVLGITIDTSRVQDSHDVEIKSTWCTKTNKQKVKKDKKISVWGEPTFCPQLGVFRCPVKDCGKLCAKASQVRAHLRRHSGEKPYKCTWSGCEWRFARSDELARHRRSHSGDKPYRCSECGKKFARSDHLAKHGRVHERRAAAAAAAAAAKRLTATYTRTRRFLC